MARVHHRQGGADIFFAYRVILLVRTIKLAKFSYTLRKTIHLGESWSFCNLLSFTPSFPSFFFLRRVPRTSNRCKYRCKNRKKGGSREAIAERPTPFPTNSRSGILRGSVFAAKIYTDFTPNNRARSAALFLGVKSV